jgi:hypothetical protein
VTLKLASAAPIWVLVLVAALVIAIATPHREYFTWLPIALAASILVTFAVQLTLRRKEGFVGRLTLTAVGSLVILGIATIVLVIVR